MKIHTTQYGFQDELQNYINALKTVASTVSSEGYILNQMTSDELKTLARINVKAHR